MNLDSIRDELKTLAMREHKLTAPIYRISLGIVGLLFCSLMANIVMQIMMPTATLISIHIPPELLEYFSDSESAQKNTLQYSSLLFNQHSESVINFGKNIFAVLLVVSGLGIFFKALLKFKDLVAGGDDDLLHSTGGMIFSLLMIGGSISLFNSSTDTITPRSEFVEQVESHQFNKVYNSLNTINQDTTPAALYVLAQMSLFEDQEENEGLMKRFITPEIAEKISAPDSGFVGELDSLYAIEMAAYGEIKSPLVTAQIDTMKEWSADISVLTKINLGACAVAGLFVLGLVTIRRSIRRRLERIHKIIGSPQKQAYFDEESIERVDQLQAK